ncbi:MAG: DUF819 family protein [Clostridiales bacterium]|nr:DUF819 family protein [Clostridiales bacterium]
MMMIIQILLIFIVPYLIILGSRKFKIIKILSPILLAYGIGIIWGVLEVIPLDRDLSMTISEICVPIAIPLILFSADFKKFIHSAKSTVISFVLVIVAAFSSALLTGIFLNSQLAEASKISGMLVGCYTGGTPNLMAIGMGLNISEETLIVVNTSDMIIGALFFLLIISILKPLLAKFLKPYKSDSIIEQIEERINFRELEKKEKITEVKRSSLILIFCIGILGIAVGIAMLITGKMNVAIIMLFVTTAGIIGSFSKQIRKVKYTYEIGQYIILVFSMALGTTVNLQEMLKASPIILMYVTITMFGAIILHLILAKTFRIDVDTAIITMTAGIYGPAFVVPVAEGIKNKEVVVAGLTCGLVGYAVGNYLGYLVHYLVNLLL